jgi:hypothetical protein
MPFVVLRFRLQHLHAQRVHPLGEGAGRDFGRDLRGRSLEQTLLRLRRRQHLDAHVHSALLWLRPQDQEILLQVSFSKHIWCKKLLFILRFFTRPRNLISFEVEIKVNLYSSSSACFSKSSLSPLRP